jgi:hypothetical protein
MSVSRGERARLLATWNQKWSCSRPAADELKSLFRDRWVRFHSLPGSKRYADTEAEYEILLDRHHTVLLELAGPAYGTTDALILTMSWSSSDRPARRAQAVVVTAPNAKHWASFVSDDSDPESVIWWHAYLSRLPLADDGLDPLLRVVADDRTWGVVIAPDSLDWLYHPYDGGADVLLPSAARRDELAAAHRDWLSPHPAGL